MSIEKILIISKDIKIHARPAHKIAKIAMKAQGLVSIIKNSLEADAKSLIDIISLNIKQGDEITLKTSKACDEEILKEIENLLRKGFS